MSRRRQIYQKNSQPQTPSVAAVGAEPGSSSPAPSPIWKADFSLQPGMVVTMAGEPTRVFMEMPKRKTLRLKKGKPDGKA